MALGFPDADFGIVFHYQDVVSPPAIEDYNLGLPERA
jgi:hypothetical protein